MVSELFTTVEDTLFILSEAIFDFRPKNIFRQILFTINSGFNELVRRVGPIDQKFHQHRGDVILVLSTNVEFRLFLESICSYDRDRQ